MVIEIGNKKYEIKEIKYKDLADFGTLPPGEAAKKMMLLSTGMSEEEYENLSMKEGVELQTAINDLNGLEDFQKPLTN